jgi:hypothetical protein
VTALPTPSGPTPTLPTSPLVAPPTPLEFPLSWLLEVAPPPIQYRAAIEVARLPLTGSRSFSALPYAYQPAMELALSQLVDGTWNHSMLAIPVAKAEHFKGIGTISAVRRLLEYGWDRESPPLLQARRVLFRLLAEDDDPAYLYELGSKGKMELAMVRHGRAIMREAAAATLAQAGYENDPRLRGAARRILERVDLFLKSPLAQKPFIRVGNHHVLAPGASPPSVNTLIMLAHMPLYRSEHYDLLDRLYTQLSQPQPRQEAATMVGSKIVLEPHLVLGDPLPHRNAADADMPSALFWLETFARLGFLRRNEGWTKLYERLIDDCDSAGVWREPKRTATMRSDSPYAWPAFPLEPQATAEERWSDVTFRLGVIARHSGRPINLS